MVEVAQRVDASELQSIVSHLDAWVASGDPAVDLLYSGRSTSARMARLVRNENQRRASLNIPGRIVFLKLDDLEAFLARWKGLPATESPATELSEIFKRHADCTDDLTAAEVMRECLFPTWESKRVELSNEVTLRLISQQEHLKKDIQKLENKLRERGITGPRAHHCLIYLFFMALYEDKRGKDTRATKQAFLAYRDRMSNADKNNPEFQQRTIHHLISREILEDTEVKTAGIPTEYQKIELPDDFVVKEVIPVFEAYSFADASIDAIGAVFEAMARRAEKDNRIGQFFTPETAVAATCRLAGLRPTDVVNDPACGTGRFLIRSMTMMCALAHTVSGVTREQAIKSIKEHQILGCDIDPWVAVIAKMNMYIHGDGKSNIRCANGLTLASVASFAPQRPKPLINLLDVVVANPPLGEIDFIAVSEDAARRLTKADVSSAADLTKRASDWSSSNLKVIPHTVIEQEVRDKAAQKAAEWRDRAAEAKLVGDGAKAAKARKQAEDWDEKRAAADKAIGAGNVHYRPAGRTAKGGALFLSSTLRCLKTVRDASLPVEWKGGVLGIIMDEAVLNTRDYATARAFMIENFFIKAVVSLPRDAFADLAKTTAKTSILLLVKKEDPAVIQREPIFFARAERIGPSGANLTRPDDLINICDAFDTWRTGILDFCAKESKEVPTTNALRKIFTRAKAAGHGIGQVAVRYMDSATPEERLDEAFWCMKELVSLIPDPVPLSRLADLIVNSDRIPPERTVYSFASVSRVEGRVRAKGSMATAYGVSDLQEVCTGDILVSGIDLVHGAVGVVSEECNAMVVFKEYFILRAKAGVDPYWLVSLLRTGAIRRIVEGTITGTSNRTRVESPSVLMQLQLPKAPIASKQAEIGGHLRAAGKHQKDMVQSILAAGLEAAKVADLPFDMLLNDNLTEAA